MFYEFLKYIFMRSHDQLLNYLNGLNTKPRTLFLCTPGRIRGREGGGHRNCQDWAHRIFRHKKSSGQSLSEKFSSRFYATSHRTEVAHLELGTGLFRSIYSLFSYSSQSSFRPWPAVPFRASFEQKLSPRRYDKQNSKSIQKCHRTLVRGHAILPSYEVVATLI